jgi:hypothetical protein
MVTCPMVKSAGNNARCAGVSLVECLVASALALSLLTGIVMVAAELIATTQAMERRSDQVTRTGQLFTFLERMVATAGLPSQWPQPAVASLQLGATSADPCTPPSARDVSTTWGGIWIVDLAALDCIDPNESSQALYIERVETCGDVCPQQALLPAVCTKQQEALLSHSGWVVGEWGGGVADHECLEQFGWGSLSQILIYHRPRVETRDRSSDLVMRQAFPGKGDQWSTPEALIQGVVTWELGYAQLADVQALAEGARPPVVRVTVGAASGTTTALEELIQLRRTLIAPSLKRALLARNKAGS